MEHTGATAMRAFLAACLTIAVLAIGASLVLNNLNKPVDVAFRTSGVRL
jgi:hypothetical protein